MRYKTNAKIIFSAISASILATSLASCSTEEITSSDANTIVENSLESNSSNIVSEEINETEVDPELAVFKNNFYDKSIVYLKSIENMPTKVKRQTNFYDFNYYISPDQNAFYSKVSSRENPENIVKEIYCEGFNNETISCWTKNVDLENQNEWYSRDPISLISQWGEPLIETKNLHEWVMAEAFSLSNCNSNNAKLAYDKEDATFIVTSDIPTPENVQEFGRTSQKVEMIFSGDTFTTTSTYLNDSVEEEFESFNLIFSPIEVNQWEQIPSFFPTEAEKNSAEFVSNDVLDEIESTQYQKIVEESPLTDENSSQ